MDFSHCNVLREHLNIDILCVDEENKILFAIENKIGSREHSNQLYKYRNKLAKEYQGYQTILAYLTPERDDPSDDNWVPIGYEDVLSTVETIYGNRGQMVGNAVSVALDQYARMLRKYIVTDDKLVNTANAFYRKHKDALDFIFEQRRDNQLEIKELASKLAEKYPRIEIVRQSKSNINFFPSDWKGVPAFNISPKEKWTKSGHNLLFEIRNHSSSVRMAVVIGPTEQEHIRKQIHNYCRKNPSIFRGVVKTFYVEYTTIYSNTFLTKNTLENKSIDEIKKEYEKKFIQFMETEFTGIVDALTEQFSEVRADQPQLDRDS